MKPMLIWYLFNKYDWLGRYSDRSLVRLYRINRPNLIHILHDIGLVVVTVSHILLLNSNQNNIMNYSNFIQIFFQNFLIFLWSH